MSARLDTLPSYRRMTAQDLEVVTAMEQAVYPYPWTRGNFSDSLAAGYQCWIAGCGNVVTGYSVVMMAAGEAHLLNLSIAAQWQRRGLGSELLRFIVRRARDEAAARIYLEVRRSNSAALALYARAGFGEIALRRGYYPALDGREDAVVMALDLEQRAW